MKDLTFDAYFDTAIERFLEWLNTTFSDLFEGMSTIIEVLLSVVEKTLLFIPAFLIIGVVAAIAWRTAGRMMGIFTVIGSLFCYFAGLWDATMVTTALVIVATIGALLIAIPFGILSAWNNTVGHITRPLMDFMQTMPPYVYLIPAIAILGFGGSPAVFATAIVAIPPPLRLTNLGIAHVPVEQVEAGKAFGATATQILTKIQIPSALPTIMAGVNQCLMLSLSMAVIAGIIGGGGLGKDVYAAIRYLKMGKAFDAGLAIVILAIVLDRISQGTIEFFRKGRQKR